MENFLFMWQVNMHVKWPLGSYNVLIIQTNSRLSILSNLLWVQTVPTIDIFISYMEQMISFFAI